MSIMVLNRIEKYVLVQRRLGTIRCYMDKGHIIRDTVILGFTCYSAKQEERNNKTPFSKATFLSLGEYTTFRKQ